MARKPIRGEEEHVLTGPMHKYLTALGLRSVAAYFTWCTARGFTAALKKSRKELDAERAVITLQKAHADQQARLHRNPRKLIEAMCKGEITAAEISRPQLQQLCSSIERSTTKPEARASLQAFLLWAWAAGLTLSPYVRAAA